MDSSKPAKIGRPRPARNGIFSPRWAGPAFGRRRNRVPRCRRRAVTLSIRLYGGVLRIAETAPLPNHRSSAAIHQDGAGITQVGTDRAQVPATSSRSASVARRSITRRSTGGRRKGVGHHRARLAQARFPRLGDLPDFGVRDGVAAGSGPRAPTPLFGRRRTASSRRRWPQSGPRTSRTTGVGPAWKRAAPFRRASGLGMGTALSIANYRRQPLISLACALSPSFLSSATASPRSAAVSPPVAASIAAA